MGIGSVRLEVGNKLVFNEVEDREERIGMCREVPDKGTMQGIRQDCFLLVKENEEVKRFGAA